MIALVVFVALLALNTAQPTPGCICLEQLDAATGLLSPTVFRHVNDDRLFISELHGVTHIFRDGQRLPEPFLDIRDWVTVGGEQGFLSLAFHPSHADNGIVYVYYSMVIPGQECTVGSVTGTRYTRLSEMTLLDADHVDRDSERVLLDFCQPYTNHNGGDLLFDDDGYLLVFVGDGGWGGDPFDNALNMGSLLGKTLRIDIDTRDEGLPYGIPADNPYLDDPEALPELYNIGLRNPWRVSMDMGDPVTGEGQGRVFIGDVGEVDYEEIDILYKGVNYGWAAWEGRMCFKPELCDQVVDVVWPVHYYPRNVGRCIIGGYVYRGSQSPAFNGWYIFGDYMDGKLFRMLDGEGPEDWPVSELTTCSSCPEGTTNTFLPAILSFGQDPEGEVYFTAVPNFGFSGAVYRIVDPETYVQKK